MDGGAWWAAVHGIAKSRTRLSDFTFVFHFHALEKEMATHSSVLAWRIPGTEEPGGLPSMGSHRVGHDWGDLAAATAGNDQLGYIPDAEIQQSTLPSWIAFATERIFCLYVEDLMVYLGLPTDLHQTVFFFFFNFLDLISILLEFISNF